MRGNLLVWFEMTHSNGVFAGSGGYHSTDFDNLAFKTLILDFKLSFLDFKIIFSDFKSSISDFK